MGRLLIHTENDASGVLVYQRSNITYDKTSQILSERTSVRQIAPSTAYTDSTIAYSYTDASNNYVGLLTSVVSTSSGTESTTQYTYAWWDDAKQTFISYQPSATGATTTTALRYDAKGHLLTAVVPGTGGKTVLYTTDSTGQVLTRRDTLGAQVRYYYFDGIRVGDVGNTGETQTDYAAAIRQRTQAPATGFTPVQYTDFDQSYDPIGPGSQAQSAGRYGVRDGDTLQSIAQAVWGDSSLWYILADANGLSGAEELAAGTSLIVPNKVVNVHNNADTFRPYDPNKAIGDLSPLPPAPPKAGGCGLVGTVIMVIVAIVVTIYTAGAASAAIYAALGTTAAAASAATVVAVGLASAAIGGAVGSIASQAVGIAIGAQDKFSWNAVGISALSAMVTQGLGGWSPTSNAIANSAIRGATASVVTQGVAVATGMQSKFDWTSVAVAGVSAGVGAWTGTELGQYAADKKIGWLQNGTLANDGLSSLAGGAAGAASRSLVDGSNFGDNLKRAIPDIIGQTIGNMAARQAAHTTENRSKSGDKNVARSGGAGGDQQGSSLIPPGKRYIVSPDDGYYPTVGDAQIQESSSDHISAIVDVGGRKAAVELISPDAREYDIGADAKMAYTLKNGKIVASKSWYDYINDKASNFEFVDSDIIQAGAPVTLTNEELSRSFNESHPEFAGQTLTAGRSGSDRYFHDVGMAFRRGWNEAADQVRRDASPQTLQDSVRIAGDNFGVLRALDVLALAGRPFGNGIGALFGPIISDGPMDAVSDRLVAETNAAHPFFLDPHHATTGQERRDFAGQVVIGVATAKVPFMPRGASVDATPTRIFANLGEGQSARVGGITAGGGPVFRGAPINPEAFAPRITGLGNLTKGEVVPMGLRGNPVTAETTATAEARGGTYLLRDADGAIVRSGRTNDLARREAEHLRDPALAEYQFEPAYRTDSYPEQRGLEQILHDQYNPPLNKIRPISPSNKNLPTYMDAVQKYLLEHGGQ